MTRPDNPDKEKYGNATVSAQDVERGNLLSSTVLEVVGLTQTAATGGQHAGYLRLQAEVTSNYRVSRRANSYGFSVAAIPIAIRTSGAANQPGEHPPGRPDDWFWGVVYTDAVLPDGGSLDNAFAKEDIRVVEATGIFKGTPILKGDWERATNQFYDWVGRIVGVKEGLPATKDAAAKWLRGEIYKKRGVHTVEQAFRFYTARLEAKPKRIEDGHLVRESGFMIERKAVFTVVDPPKGYSSLHSRKIPHRYNPPEPGVMDPATAGTRIVIV